MSQCRLFTIPMAFKQEFLGKNWQFWRSILNNFCPSQVLFARTYIIRRLYACWYWRWHKSLPGRKRKRNSMRAQSVSIFCVARMSDLCSWIKTSLVLRDWSLCRLSGSKAILSQSGTKVVAFLIATRHLTFLRWLMLAPWLPVVIIVRRPSKSNSLEVW